MATRYEVEQKIWVAAQAEAGESGFTKDCEDLVRDFVQRGVDRIEREGFLDDENRIAIAEVHIKEFISEMKGGVRHMVPPILNESTFKQALLHLCPLFPFC
jgi:hypothetical protein